MDKKTIWIIVGVLVVAGVVYFSMKKSPGTAPLDTTTTQSGTNTNPTAKKTVKTPAQLQAEADSCKGVTGQKIVVDSPNGGEMFTTGESVTVTWHTCNPKPGQTVTLALGTLVSNSTTVAPSVKFSPAETVNDGEEGVVFGPKSLEGQAWPFAPGKNFVVTATLNPPATEIEGAPYVYDQSDKPFEVK
jgi:hypothetical protein